MVPGISTSFIFMAEYATFGISAHQLIDNLGCFHFLTITSSGAINRHRQVFV